MGDDIRQGRMPAFRVRGQSRSPGPALEEPPWWRFVRPMLLTLAAVVMSLKGNTPNPSRESSIRWDGASRYMDEL